MAPQAELSDARASERFYDDRYAQGYMDDWPAAKLARVREIVAGLGLPACGTAVDFGCGGGVFTAVLRECLPGWRIVGLDISRTALDIARRTVPACEFCHLDEATVPGAACPAAEFVPLAACPPAESVPLAACPPVQPGSVDLLFTHHVLEHVADLEHTWRTMVGLAGQRSWMLHVLPCGNPGSYEYELCRLRGDGIDPSRGGRFFYEDEGHLRRLTTDQLTRLAGQFEFGTVRGWYSFHQFEAVDWLTNNGMRFVMNLCDPSRAVDGVARRRLKSIRRQLLPMAAVKSMARRRSPWLRPCALLARILANRWAAAAQREWEAMRDDPAGSEMYIVFRQTDL